MCGEYRRAQTARIDVVIRCHQNRGAVTEKPVSSVARRHAAEHNLDTLAQDLASLAIAVGSAIVVRDGAEKEGTVPVFFGNTAALIGDPLASGAFD